LSESPKPPSLPPLVDSREAIHTLQSQVLEVRQEQAEVRREQAVISTTLATVVRELSALKAMRVPSRWPERAIQGGIFVMLIVHYFR
jgi:hypothetical protein